MWGVGADLRAFIKRKQGVDEMWGMAQESSAWRWGRVGWGLETWSLPPRKDGAGRGKTGKEKTSTEKKGGGGGERMIEADQGPEICEVYIGFLFHEEYTYTFSFKKRVVYTVESA